MEIDNIDSVVCKHCGYRHSDACNDGSPYPSRGCRNFDMDAESFDMKSLELLLLFELLKEEDN